MDRGAWRAAVRVVTENRTQLSESNAPAGVPLKTYISQRQDRGELPFAFSFLQIFRREQALLTF